MRCRFHLYPCIVVILLSTAIASCAPQAGPKPPDISISGTPKPSPVATSKTPQVPSDTHAELEGDDTCQDTSGILAYAETKNFYIYICGDRQAPTQARFYRSKNKDGSPGLNLEATDYNPRQGDGFTFLNQGYRYALQSSTLQQPAELQVTLPDGKSFREPLDRFITVPTKPSSVSSSGASPIPTSSLANSSLANSPISEDEVWNYLMENRQALGICKPRDPERSRSLFRIYPLAGEKAIAELLCFTAAYQVNSEYLLFVRQSDRVTLTPLKLMLYDQEAGGKLRQTEERAIAGLSTYNPQTRELKVLTKFRGLADCGSLSRYSFANDAFTLLEFRAKFDCDGHYTEPSQYPQIFPLQ